MFKTKKIISVFLAAVMFSQIVIAGIVLPVKQADADMPVVDFSQIASTVWGFITGAWDYAHKAWDKSTSTTTAASSATSAAADTTVAALTLEDKIEKWTGYLLRISWNVLRKTLLDMLVNNIIQWIQGGGNPKFVSNWKDFLEDAANRAGGMFLEEVAPWLCDSFSSEVVNVALGTVPPFKEEIGCTIEDAIGNVEDFLDDIRKGGGWDGWLALTQSNNNVFGAYWGVLGQKIAIEAKARTAAENEGISSSGFLGDKVCEVRDEESMEMCMEDGSATEKECEEDCCEKWRVRTPGRILGDATAKAANLDIDWLISSKEFAEYAGSIFDAVINRVSREGLSAMTTDNYKHHDRQSSSDLIAQYSNVDDLVNSQIKDYGSDLENSNAETLGIAERYSQRSMLVGFKSLLYDIKKDIGTIYKYQVEQESLSTAMLDCHNTKYQTCVFKAGSIAAAKADIYCASYVNVPAKFSLCKNLVKEKYTEALTKKCEATSDLVLSAEAEDEEKIPSLSEMAETAQDYYDYLSDKDNSADIQRIYAQMDVELLVTNSILQKLEFFKSFDECIEETCLTSNDPAECKKMAISPSMNSYVSSRCEEEKKETYNKCVDEACLTGAALIETSDESVVTEKECKENPPVKFIEQCQTESQTAYSSCKNSFPGSGEANKNFLPDGKGVCYEKDVLIVTNSTFQTTNPELDSCVKSACGEPASTDCYNKVLTPPYLIPEENPDPAKGMCYDEQFKKMSFDDLNNPEFTVTEDDINFIKDIEENKQKEYSTLVAEIEKNLSSTQKTDEKCYDGSSIPDAEANEYEAVKYCITNMMDQCLPIPVDYLKYEANRKYVEDCVMKGSNDWYNCDYKTYPETRRLYWEEAWLPTIDANNDGKADIESLWEKTGWAFQKNRDGKTITIENPYHWPELFKLTSEEDNAIKAGIEAVLNPPAT